MDVDLLFRIAGVGILVAILSIVLSKSGRDDIAQMVTLGGVVIVLLMVVTVINELFISVRQLFGLG